MPLKNDLKAAGAVVQATGVGASIVFETIVPACSLISLIVALFVTPVSKIMGDFLAFYRNATQAIFWPLHAVFNLQVPELLRDLLVFWTVSGAIGAGAFLLLVHNMYKLSMSVVEKKQQAEARQDWIDSGLSAEDFDRELEFARSIAARSDTTKLTKNFCHGYRHYNRAAVFHSHMENMSARARCSPSQWSCGTYSLHLRRFGLDDSLLRDVLCGALIVEVEKRRSQSLGPDS